MAAMKGYDKIEDDAGDIDSAIDSSQAIAVALRKFAGDPKTTIQAEAEARRCKAISTPP